MAKQGNIPSELAQVDAADYHTEKPNHYWNSLFFRKCYYDHVLHKQDQQLTIELPRQRRHRGEMHVPSTPPGQRESVFHVDFNSWRRIYPTQLT